MRQLDKQAEESFLTREREKRIEKEESQAENIQLDTLGNIPVSQYTTMNYTTLKIIFHSQIRDHNLFEDNTAVHENKGRNTCRLFTCSEYNFVALIYFL